MPKKIEHPFAEKLLELGKWAIDGEDFEQWPTDPQKFLDYTWQRAQVCTMCALCESRNLVVKPDGDARADIMVIGEGPGFLEDLTGVPLVGPPELRGSRCSHCRNVSDCYSARILSKPGGRSGRPKEVKCDPDFTDRPELPQRPFYIQSAGSVFDGILVKQFKYAYPRLNWITQYNQLHPDEPWTHHSPWFITNTIMCRSFDAIKLKDVAPSVVSRKMCRKWLAMQWAAIKPKVILCLGRSALEVLMGSMDKAASVSDGEMVNTKWGDVQFSYHPAHYMRASEREVRAYGFAKLANSISKTLEYCGYPT